LVFLSASSSDDDSLLELEDSAFFCGCFAAGAVAGAAFLGGGLAESLSELLSLELDWWIRLIASLASCGSFFLTTGFFVSSSDSLKQYTINLFLSRILEQHSQKFNCLCRWQQKI